MIFFCSNYIQLHVPFGRSIICIHVILRQHYCSATCYCVSFLSMSTLVNFSTQCTCANYRSILLYFSFCSKKKLKCGGGGTQKKKKKNHSQVRENELYRRRRRRKRGVKGEENVAQVWCSTADRSLNPLQLSVLQSKGN